MVNLTKGEIYALGYRKCWEDMMRIFRDIDAKHPEYPMPMELTERVGRLKGQVDDYLWEVDENEHDTTIH